ncbi:unnamed protein product, partial [Protopolystoma xenopodis]
MSCHLAFRVDAVHLGERKKIGRVRCLLVYLQLLRSSPGDTRLVSLKKIYYLKGWNCWTNGSQYLPIKSALKYNGLPEERMNGLSDNQYLNLIVVAAHGLGLMFDVPLGGINESTTPYPAVVGPDHSSCFVKPQNPHLFGSCSRSSGRQKSITSNDSANLPSAIQDGFVSEGEFSVVTLPTAGHLAACG